MRSPVLVGRSAELTAVRRMVETTAAGTGGALLVAGEAGIGKTRMLDEAASRAAALGMAVLTGRAVQGGGTYRAVAQAVIGTLDRPALRDAEGLRPYRAALGRLLPGWEGDSPGPPDVDPVVVLGEGLVRLLGALDAPGCLLRLEDLHWADDDTLALVEHLAGSLARVPVLLAVSARDDAPAHAARRLAAAPGMTTLRLHRLGGAEVAALAAACGDGRPVDAEQVRWLQDRSEGLPFLVEELVGGAGDDVPPTLAGLVDARLAALDAEQRGVLVAAAVLGGEPDWRLLAATVDVDEPAALQALRAAVDAGLLTTRTGRLSWPHALTRDAVLATLLPPERAALAGRAAVALARRAGADDEPRAAELFVEAGEPDRAAGLLLELGRRAAARGALRSAEQLLDAAAATGARAAEVTIERVAVLATVGRVDEAVALGEKEVDGLAGDAHAELCLRLARAAVVGARWTAAEQYVERAGRPDDPRSLVLRADAAFGAGRTDEAEVLATAAVERAEQVGAYSVLCEAFSIMARALSNTDPATMTTVLRRSAQVAAEHGLTLRRVEVMAQLGLSETMGSADPVVALQRARELALDAGMLAQLVSIDTVLGDLVLTQDGPRAAEEVALRAARTVAPLRLEELRATIDVQLAGCLGARGDAAGMAAIIEATLRRAGDDGEIAAHAAMARALSALLDHDLPQARQHTDAATGFLLGHESAPPLIVFGLWALLHAAAGDAVAAARIRSHPSRFRTANRGALAYADAIGLGREGRSADAADRLAEGDAELVRLHWWRRVLRLVVLESAVADGWGDPVPQLRADLAVHEAAGDDRLARTCRDLLRRAGRPTRRGRGQSAVPPALRALGVTSREVDVLELVTRGLTNAQVADRLFLSPRTVDTHVASLLAKTGSATRGELGAWASSQTR